ncbi:MAG: tetratricopeptide repeat protein [Myxococcota bacterium]
MPLRCLSFAVLALTMFSCDRARNESTSEESAPDQTTAQVPTADARAKRAAGASMAEACEEGNTARCNELGQMYFKGKGLEPDPERAFELFEASCHGGDMKGCANLAILLERGTGAPRDVERALILNQQACASEVLIACTNLGVMLLGGKGIKKDLDRARGIFELACTKGADARACANLGFMVEKGLGGAKDMERALALYRSSCAGGDMQGCTNLGILCAPGNTAGQPEDPARAHLLFGKACAGEHVEGCVMLGASYVNGWGVEVDLEQGRSIFEQACERGSAKGCSSLAQMLRNERDERAPDLFEQACTLSAPIGCKEGAAMLKGEDGERAAQLYGRACDAFDLTGCVALAIMNEEGRDIPKDLEFARALARRTCEAGSKPACEMAERLR